MSDDDPILQVCLNVPDFLAWLREAYETGYVQSAADHYGAHPDPDDPHALDGIGFEEWVSKRLGTDWVPPSTPKMPDR